MISFLKYYFFCYLIIEFSPIFWFFHDNDINSHDLFIYEFLILMYFNTKFNEKKNNIDLDIIFKYFSIVFKMPNVFLNLFLNIFKKIYTFLVYFKYKYIVITYKIISKKYFNTFFILWRPLFKKTSYFGYYRSNRSKWIK